MPIAWREKPSIVPVDAAYPVTNSCPVNRWSPIQSFPRSHLLSAAASATVAGASKALSDPLLLSPTRWLCVYKLQTKAGYYCQKGHEYLFAWLASLRLGKEPCWQPGASRSIWESRFLQLCIGTTVWPTRRSLISVASSHP